MTKGIGTGGLIVIGLIIWWLTTRKPTGVQAAELLPRATIIDSVSGSVKVGAIPPMPPGMLPSTMEWYWTGTEWKSREKPVLGGVVPYYGEIITDKEVIVYA